MQPRAPSLLARFAITFVLVLALVVRGGHARADGKTEATALGLQKKAMGQDYLVSDFAKAQEKLERAITLCGAEKCGAPIRARLRRDLGVVQIANGARERGISAFVDALSIDGAVALDPDTRTPDLDAAFAEARRRLGGGSSGGATAAPGQPRGGDFEHTPAAAQQVRTGVPVYVEYFGTAKLVRVVVQYRGAAMPAFQPVELRHLTDRGWGGILPCADVQPGAMVYFVQGFDDKGDHVAAGGDRVTPYRVPIKTEAVAEPPHLPNDKAPVQCTESVDCPPGTPGCQALPPVPVGEHDVTDKALGEPCDGGVECKSNRCEGGRCVDPNAKPKRRKLWLGVAGAVDYTFVPSADDVCKLKPDDYPVNTSNFYCVKPDKSDYPSREIVNGATENDSIVATSQHGSDKVDGGGAIGSVRLMIAADLALSDNVLLGARLGLVLIRYPGSSAGIDHNHFGPPIHAEVRGTYVFGREAIARDGFAPYAFVGAGVAPFETKVGVQTVQLRPGSPPVEQDANAWQIAGPLFFSVGGGGRWLLSSRVALMIGARGNLAFIHAFAPSVGPELSAQVGF